MEKQIQEKEEITLQERIHASALEIYERMLPTVLSTYGPKYCRIDRINTLDDFKSLFYLVVYNAVCLYDATHKSKGSSQIVEWKKSNGKTKHRMKIETFVIEQLKKELDKQMNFEVIVKKGDYTETMSYSSFVKRRAYLKANNYEITFLKQEIPFSLLAGGNSDSDDSIDPELYREGLQDEINDILYR